MERELPPDIADALRKHPQAYRAFQGLDRADQDELLGWIAAASSSEHRSRRISIVISLISA